MNYTDMLRIMPYMQAAQSIGKNPLTPTGQHQQFLSGGGENNPLAPMGRTFPGPGLGPGHGGGAQQPYTAQAPRDLGDYPKDERKRAEVQQAAKNPLDPMALFSNPLIGAGMGMLAGSMPRPQSQAHINPWQAGLEGGLQAGALGLTQDKIATDKRISEQKLTLEKQKIQNKEMKDFADYAIKLAKFNYPEDIIELMLLGKYPELFEMQKELKQASGTNIEVNTGDLTNKTRSDLQEATIGYQESLAEMENIKKLTKPEFLEIPNRLEMLATVWQEKAAIPGFKPSEERKKALYEFSNWKRDAHHALNKYIKQITGAQMSFYEAERLMLAMPKPGTGILDGDSYTEFKSGYDSVITRLEAAQLRTELLLQEGFEFNNENPMTDTIAVKYRLTDFEKAANAIAEGRDKDLVMQKLREHYDPKL